MFTIVTHHSPDLDAITSTWLLIRFLPNWQQVQVKFVPAGKTLDGQIPESDQKVLHVDTGFGMLDHHQSDEDTCAAKKVYEYIKKELNNEKRDSRFRGNDSSVWEDEALERICDVVNFYDHFREAKLPDATADYHMMDGANVIDGLKSIYQDDDHKIVEIGMIMLDAIYKLFKERVWAEEIIDHEAVHFETPCGKGIGFETINDAVLKVSQKMGYVVAVRKDSKKGYVRIKGAPETAVDFTKAYEVLKEKDPEATWFLHSSKKILLNGTTKNPDMKPTKLSLSDIIEVLKK